MKTIKLVNKKEYIVTDDSTIERFSITFKTLAEVSEAETNFTADNMKTVHFEEVEHNFVTPSGLFIEKTPEGYLATWSNRLESEVEKALRIAQEAQIALAELSELVAGGQQ